MIFEFTERFTDARSYVPIYYIYIATESVTWQLVSRYAPVHCRNIPYSRFACWKTHGTENSRLPRVFRREFQRPVSTHRARRYYLFFRRNMSTSGPPYIMRARWNPNTCTFCVWGKRVPIATGKNVKQNFSDVGRDGKGRTKNIAQSFSGNRGLFRVPMVYTTIYLYLCAHIWDMCIKNVFMMPKVTNKKSHRY